MKIHNKTLMVIVSIVMLFGCHAAEANSKTKSPTNFVADLENCKYESDRKIIKLNTENEIKKDPYNKFFVGEFHETHITKLVRACTTNVIHFGSDKRNERYAAIIINSINYDEFTHEFARNVNTAVIGAYAAGLCKHFVDENVPVIEKQDFFILKVNGIIKYVHRSQC